MYKHVVEGVSSTCDLCVVANEFEYLLRKNGENCRYFRQRFALYPSVMEKCILSVKCPTVRPYFILDVLDAPNFNGHDVTHIFKHCGQSTRTLWYDGGEACARRKLLQGFRGYVNDHILWVTFSNKGRVSDSFNTALFILVYRIFYLNGRG